MKKTYWEKLQDPRWQKLRLEAMSSNDFCCEICGDGESTLNVHHKEYFKDHNPWDYALGQLAVLCENCHHHLHSKLDPLKFLCSLLRLSGPFDRDEIAVLIAGYLGIEYKEMLKWFGFDDMKWMQDIYDSGFKAGELQRGKYAK
jgi:hypothetical protein